MVDQIFLDAFGLNDSMHITRLELLLEPQALVTLRIERYVHPAELNALAGALQTVSETYHFKRVPEPELATHAAPAAQEG
jgi:hypothetical protein